MEEIDSKEKRGFDSKVHPIDKSFCCGLGNLFVTWCSKELDKVKEADVSYEQDFHFPLPKKDSLSKSTEVFEKTFGKKKSVWKTVLSICKGELFGLLLLCALAQCLLLSYPYLLGLLVTDLREGNTKSDDDKKRIVLVFVLLAGSTILNNVFTNYVNMRVNRLSTRIANSINCMVFRKVTKFNLLNKSPYSTGNIINYVQADANKIAMFGMVITFSAQLLSLIMGVSLIFFYVGNIAWIILGIFFVGLVISLLITKCRQKITKKLLAAKDSRVATLSNVINNIKFIKIKGWENFFQYKIAFKRADELKYLLYTLLFSVLVIFINWMNNSNLMIAFVVSVTFIHPDFITLANVSRVLPVLALFFNVQIMMPVAFTIVLDVKVSFDRIQSFLLAQELRPERVGCLSKGEKEAQTVLSLRQGDFVWENIQEEEGKDKGERKGKGKKGKKAKRKGEKDDSRSLLGGSLLEGDSITEEPAKEWLFRITPGDLRIKEGSLVFVIGKTGSGKSSLLYSLCGEMNANPFSSNQIELATESDIGLLTHTPWMLPSTILQNIILDKKYDEELVNKVVTMSQLDEDFLEMPKGLETFVGENGQSVSGGQRVRIALARLFYQSPSILLLDDPLSALDTKVADRLLQDALCSELKDKTRIITTHAVNNVRFADYLIMMDEGTVICQGTYEELKDQPSFKAFVEEGLHKKDPQESDEEPPKEPKKPKQEPKEEKIEELGEKEELEARQRARKETSSTSLSKGPMRTSEIIIPDDLDTSISSRNSNLQDKKPDVSKLFLEEDRQKGRLSASTISTFIKEIGGLFPILLIFLSVFSLLFTNFLSDYFIIEWGKNFDINKKFEYFYIVLFLLTIRSVMTTVRSLIVLVSQLILTRSMHAKMTFRILHSKVAEFLERIPAGRIINRFTKDIDVLDREITYTLMAFYLNFGSVLVNSVVLVWSVGYVFLLPILVFIFFGARTQRKMMKLKRDVVRLQGISRSPMISGLSGLLRGLSEIRVLNKEKFVFLEFLDQVEDYAKNMILTMCLDCWYNIRICLLNVTLIQIPGFIFLSYFIWFNQSEYPIEKIIFFVMRSMSLSNDLTQLLTNVGNLETQLISVERCSAFSKIEPEEGYFNFKLHESKYLHPNSPEKLKEIIKNMALNDRKLIQEGRVELQNVTTKYPTKPKPVLEDLSLSIKPGQKIGVVGRTGAGKTSMIKLFWMCLHPTGGTVTLDGHDITKVDLKVLRANMDIISQDTALFEGTIRENLDPKLEYHLDKESEEFKANDKRLLEKLYDIGFTEKSLDYKGLDFHVAAGGSNLSLGQKQLLSLLRVLQSPKKLTILDEATANIDVATEALIQKIIKENLKDTTLIIIAHRLKTILDCDNICVLQQGKIVEQGNKDELLVQDGLFKSMFDKL